MDSEVRIDGVLSGGAEKTSHTVELTALVTSTDSPGLLVEGADGFVVTGTDGCLLVGYDVPSHPAGESAIA
jgi:hypothetical protein